MDDADQLAEIVLQWRESRARGAVGDPEETLQAHPAFADRLRLRFAMLAALDQIAADAHGPASRAPIALGGYTIGRELGTGGMGTVYLATARDDTCAVPVGERVAVKLLHPHLLARPGFFKRFLREAEVGRRVRHDHVVRVLDVDATVDRGSQVTYLVMEYVEGRTLRELVNDLGPVPEGLLREIATQAAAGLEAIHASGLVHRDIKPENLIISSDQRLRIMDLGIVHDTAASLACTREGEFAGSLPYAAPEQFRSEPVAPSMDLYALGVVLYELAGGWNPFQHEGAASVMRAHLEHTPRRLSELGLGVSEFLAEVVATLLAKRPTERFESSTRLREILDDAERSNWWAERSVLRQRDLGWHRPVIPVRRETRLHGRDDDLAALADAFQRAARGDGGVLLVEGEAGIGKTRLLDAFLAELDFHSATVLYGSYPPSGEASGLSDAVLGLFGKQGLASSLEPHLGGSRGLAESFASVVSRTTEVDGSISRDALHAVFSRLLSSLASERSLVWIVDDLHFASQDEQGVFLSMARAAVGSRALVVGTTRPGLPAQVLAHLGRLPKFERRTLPRLSARQVIELLRDSFHSEDLAVKLGGRIAYKSDGVPFFVFEMIRGLQHGQFVTELPDGTWVETRVVDQIAVPSTVRDLIEARLTSLSREERAILDVAAIQGFTFRADVVAQVLDRPHITILQDLANIERRAGVLRSTGRGFRFDHHQLQEIVYESIPLELRREYHGLAGEALESIDLPDPACGGRVDGEVAAQLSDQFLRADRAESACRYLDRALDHLARQQRNAAAADLLRRALGTIDAWRGAERVRRLLSLARFLHVLGVRDEERDVVDEAVRTSDEWGDSSLRAHARIALGACLSVTSHADESLVVLERAVALAEAAGDVNCEARANGNLGFALAHLGRYDEAERRHQRAHDLARMSGHERTELIELANLAEIAVRRGDAQRAREFNEQLLSRATSEETGDLRASGLIALGVSNLLSGCLTEAREQSELGLAFARDTGHRELEGRALTNLGLIAQETGHFEYARELFGSRLSIARCLDDLRGEAVVTGNLVEVHVALGDVAEAYACCRRHLALCRRVRYRGGVAIGLLDRAGVQLLLGQLRPAEVSIDRARRIATDVGSASIVAGARWLRGEASLLGGSYASAREHLEAALEGFESAGVRDTNAAFARIRLAEALDELGDHSGAHNRLREAIELSDEGGFPAPALVGRLRLSLLTGREDLTALRAFTEHETRLGVPTRLETRYLLWRLTDQFPHLREARRLVCELQRGLAPRHAASVVDGVPRNREITSAWTGHSSGGSAHDASESATRPA